MERVNLRNGTIALGHPLGASGRGTWWGCVDGDEGEGEGGSCADVGGDGDGC